MIDWLSQNWIEIVVPVLVFLATIVVGLWLRRMLFAVFVLRTAKSKWEGVRIIIDVMRGQFLLWFVLLGAGIALEISVLSEQIKSICIMAIVSLFIVSLAWALISFGDRMLLLYMPRTKTPPRTIRIISNVVRSIIFVVAILVVLEIWQVPTTPVLLVILIVAVAAFLFFRNVLPDLYASVQLNANPRFKVDDYIKLESGEEGYVEDVGWNTTLIRGLDGSSVAIPNSRLTQGTVTNYGRPLKRTNEPFRFHSRVDLPELTGVSVKNLDELTEQLKRASDSIIYYHTHHFLAEHQYLTPEPANDFAIWVTNTLGDEVLGEQLASVDTFSYTSLSGLRDRLVGIIEEHIASRPKHFQESESGMEFHFMKSISVIMDTPYRAHDLREFVEALRKVSLNSLYFHMFESRLRLGRGQNDFSIWLQDNLDETDLGRDILKLDPYTYDLEGLRSTLIQLIEKHIK